MRQKWPTMNEMMQYLRLTLYLRVALTLCMLRHDDIIQRTLENAGHRKRQINICTRSAHFFCFPQLTFQRMLILDKIPVRMYNVEPDKISRIMYLIMFWSVTMENEPLHEKTCLSGLASLKKQVDLSYACADPEFPDPPPPPGNSQVLY